MTTRTSEQVICSRTDCSNVYKRYAYQVKKNIGLYCSQSCAARAQHSVRYSSYVPSPKPCLYCGAYKGDNNKNAYCRNCFNIKSATRKFGLTIADYYSMLEGQNHRCGICKIDRCSTGKNFCVDHDHKTGSVRGLLCYSCNIRLGWYEKKKESIEEYLTS